MAKEFVGVRLPVELDRKLNEIAQENTESKTDTIIRALRQFVAGDTDRLTLHDVNDRVNALEAKIKEITNSGEPSRTKPSEDYSDKELITLDQAADLTGYAVGTLRSNLSRNDIKAKDRQGKKGLYAKAEILDRIGKR